MAKADASSLAMRRSKADIKTVDFKCLEVIVRRERHTTGSIKANRRDEPSIGKPFQSILVFSSTTPSRTAPQTNFLFSRAN